MTDLIERLEKADGPSRGLDWEIHLRNGLQGVGMYGYHPRYTASIDAAMTLVPEGCLLVLKTLWDADKTAGYAIIQHYAPTSTGGKRYDGETTGLAATPALALCIATLRAKEADNGEVR